MCVLESECEKRVVFRMSHEFMRRNYGENDDACSGTDDVSGSIVATLINTDSEKLDPFNTSARCSALLHFSSEAETHFLECVHAASSHCRQMPLYRDVGHAFEGLVSSVYECLVAGRDLAQDGLPPDECLREYYLAYGPWTELCNQAVLPEQPLDIPTEAEEIMSRLAHLTTIGGQKLQWSFVRLKWSIRHGLLLYSMTALLVNQGLLSLGDLEYVGGSITKSLGQAARHLLENGVPVVYALDLSPE